MVLLLVHSSSPLLLLVLRINEICSHRYQLILFRPITHSTSLLACPPMLSILRLAQIKRLRRSVLGRKDKEHIAMLASLGRRTGWLVLNDIVRTTVCRNIVLGESKFGKRQDRESFLRDRNIRGDPVAHFAPFRVVSGWCIRVGERNNVGQVGFCGQAVVIGLVMQGNLRLVFEVLGLDGVAQFGVVFGPSDGERETGEEVIDHYNTVSNQEIQRDYAT